MPPNMINQLGGSGNIAVQTTVQNVPDFFCHVRQVGGVVRCDCTHSVDEWGNIWAQISRGYIRFEGSPSALPNMSLAIIRYATHNGSIELVVDDTCVWERWIANHFVCKPACLGVPPRRRWTPGNNLPHVRIVHAPPNGTLNHPNVERIESSEDELTGKLKLAMDTSTWAGILGMVNDILAVPSDGLGVIGYRLSPTVITALKSRWDIWQLAFQADHSLVTQFLDVLLCTSAEIGTSSQQLRFGPLSAIPCVVHGIIFALAFAEGWQRNALPIKHGTENVDFDGIFASLCGMLLVQQEDVDQLQSSKHWKSDMVMLANSSRAPDVWRELDRKLGDPRELDLRLGNQSVRERCFISKHGDYKGVVASNDIENVRIWVNSFVSGWLVRRESLKSQAVKKALEVIDG